MAKRKHARINPPATAVTMLGATVDGEPLYSDPEPLRPVRNRAEKRALLRQLTRRRSPNVRRSDTPDSVPRV